MRTQEIEMDGPKRLDYGRPQKRKASVSRRDLAGAFFILFSIPAGFMAILALVAAVRWLVAPTAIDVSAGGLIVFSVVVTGAVFAMFSFVMIRSAVRRLRPQRRG